MTVIALILDGLFRATHVAAILVWMGHNWANFVARPRFNRVLVSDPPEKIDSVFYAAMRREHGTFRYASLIAMGTGILMLWNRGLLVDALLLRGAAAPIGIGVWGGLLMVANLWFVLWPHQKKVLGYIKAPVEERLRCARVTFLSSRTNTILSIPTVFFMVVGGHGAWPLF